MNIPKHFTLNSKVFFGLLQPKYCYFYYYSYIDFKVYLPSSSILYLLVMTRSHSKVQMIAVVILFLSLFITSFPQTQGAETVNIKDAQLLFMWGDINDKLPTTLAPEIWDGNIKVSSGNMIVLRTLWFKESNDRLITKEGATLEFNSDINSNYDGIYLRVTPNTGSQTVTFKSTNGTLLETPLSYFIDHDELVKTTASGTSIKISKVFLHTDTPINTTGTGSSLGGTIVGMANPASTNCINNGGKLNILNGIHGEYGVCSFLDGSQCEEWAFYNKSCGKGQIMTASGSTLKDPSYLLYASNDYLDKLSKSELAGLDFSKLTNMQGRLYDRLLVAGREKISELPLRVQRKAYLLEGLLPQDVADSAGISDGEEIAEWKSLLNNINEPLLMRLLDRFDSITPGLWVKIRALPTDYKDALLKFALSLRSDTTSLVLPSFIEQLSNVAALESQFELVKLKFTFDNTQVVKKMFGTLKATLFYDNGFYDAFQNLMNSANTSSHETLVTNLVSIQRIFDSNIEGSTKRKVESKTLPFLDVSDTAWYASFVHSLFDDKVVSGYKDGAGKPLDIFKPENQVTVGEGLKLILTIMHKEQANHAPKNTKNTHHWAEGFLAKAEDIGLSLTKDKDLDLNRPLTRMEMIRNVLELKDLKLPTYTKGSFTDVDINSLDGTYVEYAKELGIIKGDDTNKTFRPNDPLNRAELSKILLYARYYLMGE